MNRVRVIAIASLTVLAALGGYVVAGEAFESEWKDYTGKVSQGFAYLVPVPKGTDAIQVRLADPSDASSARVAIFDARDSRVGLYDLSIEAGDVEVSDPAVGAYVVYVYEARSAALTIRFQNADVEGLQLTKLSTAREDRVLGTFEGGNLNKKIVTELAREPLLLSLLYQGSVENLSAEILNSEGGVVASVVGESATAYAPGLWSTGHVGSAREIHPEEIIGKKFTVSATADDVQGTLYLTQITYKRVAASGVVKPVRAPDAPPTPQSVEEAEAEARVPSAPLEAGVPFALDVPAGAGAFTLLVTTKDYRESAKGHEDDWSWDGRGDNEEAEDESEDADEAEGAEDAEESDAEESEDEATDEEEAEEDEEQSWGPPSPKGWAGPGQGAGYGLVSVYSPAEELVGVFQVKAREPVTVPATVPGEYVLYMWDGYDVGVTFEGATEAPELRDLEIDVETTKLGEADLTGFSLNQTIELPTAPLGMIIATPSPESFAIDFQATIRSGKGLAFAQNSFMSIGAFEGYGYMSPENPKTLIPGAYAVKVEGASGMGEIVLHTWTYVRDSLAAQPVAEEDAGEPASAGGLNAMIADKIAVTNSIVADKVSVMGAIVADKLGL